MSSNNEETDHVANKLAWKSEPVLNLANHFHTYCGDDNQHKRVHHFEMSNEHLERFTSTETIEEMKICLAINLTRSDFTFYPVLELTYEHLPVIKHFPLEPCALSEVGFESEFVPKIFKDMIHDNWNKLDITHIDDLFIAQARNEEGIPLNQMVRVHEFVLSAEMIAFINALNVDVEVNGDPPHTEPNIQKIKMYPGVDMNKFGNEKLISFTPVLGFRHLTDSTGVLNKHGVLETTEKETFIEYTLPCPPTCRKENG